MDIKTILITELHKLLSRSCLKNGFVGTIKLPCGSELTIVVKVKKKLEIVKAG